MQVLLVVLERLNDQHLASERSYVQFSTSSFPQPVLHTRNPVLQTMTHLSHMHCQFYKLIQFYTLIENSTKLGF